MSSLPSTSAARPRSVARRAGAAVATAAVALGLAIVPGVAAADPESTEATAPVAAPRGAIAVVEGATQFAVTPEALKRLQQHDLRLVRLDAKGQTREAVPAGVPLRLDVTSGVVTNMDGRIGGRVLYEDRGLAVVNTRTRQVARLAEFESDLTRNAVLATVNQSDTIAIGRAPSQRITRETLNVADRQVRLTSPVRLSGRAAERLNRVTGTDAFERGETLARVTSQFHLDEEQDVREALGLDKDLDSVDTSQSTRQEAQERPGSAADEMATEENLRKAFPNAAG
ncbi:hypothetical protein OYE22_14455 [Streptomyces sp. 71268]|uniref:hypothetical protein n=1 Tax=Streptomyces sp. 71268 TaxID=3002640 RepID=UPI0023F94913|nr:hypothetical protein [Streptomyces sp. 71268]WEV26267.1 hypothetical protein OYE22_14455 [Streptomyces sp. 71268]